MTGEKPAVRPPDKGYLTWRQLDKIDAWLAVIIGLAALAVYVRTLAPDILYGDSAEFQALTYTLGHSHSTGYPIYLLLARLVGLLPLGTPAWRVNLFSALMAALTVSAVYLLGRMLTKNRIGPLLASLGLAVSYAFWSQAIIAEVYTPGMAFLAWALLLVLLWHLDPQRYRWSLFSAAVLLGLSLGVHATAVLAAPVAAGFVLLRMLLMRATKAEWRKTMLLGMGGAVLGLLIWLLAFLYIDWHNPPSSFFRVMLEPSRSYWNLQPEDIDSPLERIYLSVNSVQWKGAFRQGGSEAAQESFIGYLGGFMDREFSMLFLLLVFHGWWYALSRRAWETGFLLATYLFMMFFVINYHTGDQYVFFLSTYIPLMAAAGAGMGALIEGLAQIKFLKKNGLSVAVALLAGIVLAYVILHPVAKIRWEAIKAGEANFVHEDYVFPVHDLREPRGIAHMRLSEFPDQALILSDWRWLYAGAYLAYVEKEKPDILFVEAMPSGNNGQIAESMVEMIKGAMADGYKVYAEQKFPGLEKYFRVLPSATDFFIISPEKK